MTRLINKVIPWSGGLACLLVGWLMGHATPSDPTTDPEAPPSRARAATKTAVQLPADFNDLESTSRLVAMSVAEIAHWTRKLALEPDSAFHGERLKALLDRIDVSRPTAQRISCS
jgi:hypothetical protein